MLLHIGYFVYNLNNVQVIYRYFAQLIVIVLIFTLIIVLFQETTSLVNFNYMLNYFMSCVIFDALCLLHN